MKVVLRNWQFIRRKAWLIILILSLSPIIWFWGKGSVLINGIDTNFPLDPISWFIRRFYVWDAVANAGRDFSSSVAGLFFHLTQVIPYSLGANLQLTQLISLIFWFGLITTGAFIFSRALFQGRYLIQVLFVTFYSFNIFLFNTWENVKVANLSLVAAIPFGLAIFFGLNQGKISYTRAAFFAILVGLVLSGSGINPAYFITFFIVMTIFYLSLALGELNRGTIIEATKSFLWISLFIVLINLFWIVPTTSFVFETISPQASIDKIGFTNWVQSLSENTSLFNILRLQGAWDWYTVDGVTKLPVFIPYSLDYFRRIPFLVFSFLVPFLAVLSLILRKRGVNNLYLFFSVCLILGVFLGTGTHLPTGAVFSFLAEHIPFFTLFRSPWYIFTPLVFLSYAGLISLLFSYLEEKNIPLFLNTAIVILIISNLLYSYPLVTGKIFRPGRQDSFYVNFPPYVFAAANWLKENTHNRIVGYPDDEIEQFSWGYRGIESILSLLTSKEVFYSSLISPNSEISLILREFFLNLKRQTFTQTQNIAQKINIGLIFEKKDQNSITFTFPKKLMVKEEASFGSWTFYKFPEEALPKIFSAKSFYAAYPHNKGVEIVSVLGPSEVLVNSSDSVVRGIDEVSGNARNIVLSSNLLVEDLKKFGYQHKLADRLLRRETNKVELVIEIPQEGFYTPVLERYRIEDFGLSTDRITVLENGKEKVWLARQSNDSFIYFQPIFLDAGEHKIQIKLNNKNLIPFGDFETELGYSIRGGGKVEVINDDLNERGSSSNETKVSSSNKVLSIWNNTFSDDVWAVFSLRDTDKNVPYLVQLKYRQMFGNDAQVIVGQKKSDDKSPFVKLQNERFPYYLEWQIASFFYEPVKTQSNLEVSLAAPPFLEKNPLGTKVLYDDLEMYPVFTNKLIFVGVEKATNQLNRLDTPKITFKKISPVEYEGTVSGASPHVIIFSENYSPQWQLSAFSMDGKKLISKPAHFSANYFANAWFMKGTPREYKIKIYYKRQDLFILGSIASAISVIIVVAALITKVILIKRLRNA